MMSESIILQRINLELQSILQNISRWYLGNVLNNISQSNKLLFMLLQDFTQIVRLRFVAVSIKGLRCDKALQVKKYTKVYNLRQYF